MIAPGQVAVVNNVPGFIARARMTREAAVSAALVLWQESMIRTVSGKGTGRIYTHKGYTHQASSPGDPPALETGELAASIGVSAMGLSGMVGTPLIKGLWLERGTYKMAPRPFVARSFQASRHHIMSLIATRWDTGAGLSGGLTGMTGIRSVLYGAGRLLGDVSSIGGGIQGMSGIRGGLYGAARGLGDVSAFRSGSLAQRAIARGAGRHSQPFVSGMPNRVGRRAAGYGTGRVFGQVRGSL